MATDTPKQVEAISLYGLGPTAHIAPYLCGWRGTATTKEKLTDKLAAHFLASPHCYSNASKRQ